MPFVGYYGNSGVLQKRTPWNFYSISAASISSKGGMTLLKGGLPIRFGGKLAGAIGVGSGTGDEDVEVARAALAAVGADTL